MTLHASEAALFDPVTDLPLFGIMAESISDVAADVKAAQSSVAIDLVLSAIPNCTRPVLAIGPYLQGAIGVVASCRIVLLARGVQGRDLEMVKALNDQIREQLDLIMHSGNQNGLRLVFTDSTPDVDDFAPIGATHTTADDWTQP